MTRPRIDLDKLNTVSATKATDHREAPKSFHLLRHIGFRSFDIQPSQERVSDGPSVFHELAYCVAGRIWLRIWRDRYLVQSFSVEMGDIVFIPSGTSFSLCSVNEETCVLISASAREGYDVDLLPGVPNVHPFIDAQGRHLEQLHCGSSSMIEADLIYEDVVHDDGHIVLFFDRCESQSDRDDTIGSIFDRHVIAREFGLNEANLPDLSLSRSTAAVIRPFRKG